MMSNKPHLHLTDEVIDKYTDLIKARSPDSIHTFTTFFYTTLSANGYSKVSRWTKKVDIFSKEKLFIPIYKEQEKHWCLVYVNLKKKKSFLKTNCDDLGRKLKRTSGKLLVAMQSG